MRRKLRFSPAYRKAFGRTVRAARLHRGLTQLQLGRLADMDRTFIGMLERGETGIMVDRLLLLAVALDVEPGSLLPSRDHQADPGPVELDAQRVDPGLFAVEPFGHRDGSGGRVVIGQGGRQLAAVVPLDADTTLQIVRLR